MRLSAVLATKNSAPPRTRCLLSYHSKQVFATLLRQKKEEKAAFPLGEGRNQAKIFVWDLDLPPTGGCIKGAYNREEESAVLTISHYTKTYPGGKTAVDDLTLHVSPGEICGFIGRNGAGKTTTLRAVAGVMDFTQGTISIGGRDIRREPVAAKSITAFLPDNPDLYEFMSGIQYLNLVADLYAIPAQQREERIRLYGGSFSLTADLGGAIAGYSHGMKQKLALISAFVRSPGCIILDEPFVGLDPAAAFETKKLLREVCDAGGSVLFSTHVLEVAEKLCDRIAIIKGGVLVEEGETEQIVGKESLEAVFLELEQERS